VEPPPDADPLVFREYICAGLSGTGIEFGAVTSPMPVPLGCWVNFADSVTEEQLLDSVYAKLGTDIVQLDLVCDIQTMTPVPDSSMDFVLACHVLEHVPNPLGALSAAFRKLKPGGFLVLVLPEMTRTFDRRREPTSISHVREDFEDPNPYRDLIHYVEWYTKAKPVELDSVYSKVLEGFASRSDIHYHAWTHDTFGEFIDWALGAVAPFSVVWKLRSRCLSTPTSSTTCCASSYAMAGASMATATRGAAIEWPMTPIILASGSPRRAEILTRAGIPFEIRVSHVPEIREPGESATDYVCRLARSKAIAVGAQPGRIVLGADTTVCVEEAILEKPADEADAGRMLRLLSGRVHEVKTGICLVRDTDVVVDYATSRVRFSKMTEAEIAFYVASGEPMDKAGAYGIQGLASRWVEGVEGCYLNVVGLPVALVWQHLRKWVEDSACA
jgi:septum formation protein